MESGTWRGAGAGPLVSVVVPAYNGAAFLAEALRSILLQDWTPIEILVVDDGSTDDTEGIARGFGDTVRYEYQPHRGCPAAGRNKGVHLTRGPLIAFLDQDDLWPPEKLRRQVGALRANPRVDVVIGRTQVVHVARSAQGERGFETSGRVLPYMLVSATLFTRTALAAVGPFDESLRYYGDDLDWFIRARDLGVGIYTLDEITLHWRLHGGNASHRSTRDHHAGRDAALTEVVKRTLDRRRTWESGRNG